MEKNKVEELINHLNSGGTIEAKGDTHKVVRVMYRWYLFMCDVESCDRLMDATELREWLESEPTGKWEIIKLEKNNAEKT